MLAAVYYGNRDVRIEEVPEPAPGPQEVKIAVAYNGICGTDVKDYFAGPLFLPTEPHPVSGAKIPLIIGHEFSGTVVDVGEGVTDVEVGERVAVEPIYTCGQCKFCIDGLYNLCTHAYFHGGQALQGGLSQYTVVRRSMVHRLPMEIPLEKGALVEPMSVAMHGVRRARLETEDVAVVYGAGPIGVGAYLGLKAEGVTRVVVVEPSEARRAAVALLGCDTVLDPNTDNICAEIDALTDGEGARASFDAAGASSALLAAFSSTAKRGQVIILAAHEAPLQFQPNDILTRELNVTTSFAYCDDFPRVIDHMAAGRYPTTGWVEHASLEQLPEALDSLRGARATKVIIDLPA